jgi:hypothetical protein
VEFLSGQELWRDRTRALVKFGIFFGIFGGFFGCLEGLRANRNYFSETEAPAAIFPTNRDHRLIYNKLRGFFAKFMRVNIIRIISQQ